jgi:hypothetical protein
LGDADREMHRPGRSVVLPGQLEPGTKGGPIASVEAPDFHEKEIATRYSSNTCLVYAVMTPK